MKAASLISSALSVLILSLGLCSKSLAVSDDILTKKKPAEKLFEISAGIQVVNFDYSESSSLPLKSEEKGTFLAPMLEGLWFLPALNHSFLKMDFEYAGNVLTDFSGTDQTGRATSHSNNQTFGRLEFDFYGHSPWDFYFYSGLGYRYWKRYLNGGSGYREVYSWYYLPLGILYEIPVHERFDIGFDVSYRLMMGGKIEVILSETMSNGQDTTLDLGNRPGYKLQVPLRIHFPKTQSGFQFLGKIIPWYEYSEIGESNRKFNSTPVFNTNIWEPDSQTQQLGLNLLVGTEF